LPHILVELEGSRIPFKVEKYDLNDIKVQVKLDGINSLSEAEFLKSKKVFIDKKYICEGQDLLIKIIGYEAIDFIEGSLGRVIDIHSMPKQSLLCIDHNGEDLFIPFHEDIVQKIDHDHKKITVNLPKGFL